MTAIHRRVSTSGRISLPSEFREAIGLHAGGDVVMDKAGDEIRIRSVDAVVARAQALSRHIHGDAPEGSVQAPLDNRRRGTA